MTGKDPGHAATALEREVLERRAARLAAQPDLAADAEQFWVAEFPVGEEYFALPLEVMRAVIPLQAVTPVPLASPHVIGILRYQGEIISALSLASLLEGRAMRRDPQVLMVVDPGWGFLTALDCEQIPRVTALDRTLVLVARERQAGPFAEVATTDLRYVNVVDLQKLLDRRHTEVERAR